MLSMFQYARRWFRCPTCVWRGANTRYCGLEPQVGAEEGPPANTPDQLPPNTCSGAVWQSQGGSETCEGHRARAPHANQNPYQPSIFLDPPKTAPHTYNSPLVPSLTLLLASLLALPPPGFQATENG